MDDLAGALDPWRGDRFPIPARRGPLWQLASTLMIEGVRLVTRGMLACMRLSMHNMEVRRTHARFLCPFTRDPMRGSSGSKWTASCPAGSLRTGP